LNKALLDTDIYSEILKAIDPNVTRNAITYRQAHGRMTFSVITVMEIIQGFQKVGASTKRIQAFRTAIIPEEILPSIGRKRPSSPAREIRRIGNSWPMIGGT
jgi:tRNA(fMet)-specific endonuclease VapC